MIFFCCWRSRIMNFFTRFSLWFFSNAVHRSSKNLISSLKIFSFVVASNFALCVCHLAVAWPGKQRNSFSCEKSTCHGRTLDPILYVVFNFSSLWQKKVMTLQFLFLVSHFFHNNKILRFVVLLLNNRFCSLTFKSRSEQHSGLKVQSCQKHQ